MVVDPRVAALSDDEFDEAMTAPAVAQLAFVNAARRSLGKDRGSVTTIMGGSLYNTNPPR